MNFKSCKGYKRGCIFYTKLRYLNYGLTEVSKFLEEFLKCFISKTLLSEGNKQITLNWVWDF